MSCRARLIGKTDPTVEKLRRKASETDPVKQLGKRMNHLPLTLNTPVPPSPGSRYSPTAFGLLVTLIHFGGR